MGSWRNPIFNGGEGEVTKNQYCQNQYWGDCLKRGFGQFADLRRGWQERQGVFEGEGDWYPDAHYDRGTCHREN